jgi:hypothetical protein
LLSLIHFPRAFSCRGFAWRLGFGWWILLEPARVTPGYTGLYRVIPGYTGSYIAYCFFILVASRPGREFIVAARC